MLYANFRDVPTAFWRWPNFTPEEMACRHTGRLLLQLDFMDALQRVRNAMGRPLKITSGYRDPTHPAEAKKADPKAGDHVSGYAVDINVYGEAASNLMRIATGLGFKRIGVQQLPGLALNSRFIHICNRPDRPGDVWSYPKAGD